MDPLARDFYDREADAVARALLGKWLVRQEDGVTRIGRVVETEAYLGPHDLASHSARGRTPRNAAMFGPSGFAYVYMIYGVHHCLNAVTGPQGHAAAVLIRALEPVRGIEGRTRGPGLVCRALGIDRRLDGRDLTRGGALFFAEPERRLPFEIEARPRVGVGYAGAWAAEPLRFSIRGNAFVSRA
jgi:DNA-3-methyladenine glycosylase